jgi:acetyltransferase-like isoleucine patch superfamily enzyme
MKTLSINRVCWSVLDTIWLPSMSLVDRLQLFVRRADSPLSRVLKKIIGRLLSPTVPRLPRLILAPLRLAYEAHFLVIAVYGLLITVLYRNPLFQARCASFGRNVAVHGLPYVFGPVQIHVGNNVTIGGNVTILSGRMLDEPKLILKDGSSLGWNALVIVNSEVLIEENVRIPHDCRISDSDGHPREADLRRANLPPNPKDIRPVRLCRDAWIGNGTHIMKGVTIGEGAIIGANSVVISNIPAYALALGNPAEVLIKNFGLPSTMKKRPEPNPPPA